MCPFEILNGLPAYAPLALPFSKNGSGSFREGLAVRFRDLETRFGLEASKRAIRVALMSITGHPDGQQVIVIAEGAAYIIDTDLRCQTNRSDVAINFAQDIESLRIVLIGDGLEFWVVDAAGMGWQSERISWDSIGNIVIDGANLRAEAWSPMPDSWHPSS